MPRNEDADGWESLCRGGCSRRHTRNSRPTSSRNRWLTSLLFVLCLASSLPTPTHAQDCVPQSSSAIFMVYQAENPDAVFFSEDGCLAGGGRGNGCCRGSKCAVCEPNTKRSSGGKEMSWNSCLCEPCAPGSAQFRNGMTKCEPCPVGWYTRLAGQTQCDPCPPGTFNGDFGRSTLCDMCPPGTFSLSDVRAYREATTKTYRGVGTVFDPTAGASRCAPCPAGTYQPDSGGRSQEECRECPPGQFSAGGSAACDSCPGGTYQPFARQTSVHACLPCAAGTCSDTEGSEECYQCCPVANLRCDAYLKKAKGFYGLVAWYSNDGEVGRVPTDRREEFLERLCDRGCREYGVVNWCVSGVCK